MKKTILIASLLLAGALGFRLFLAVKLPSDEPDDGRVYALIARNVLDHHSYSLETEEPYAPTFIRVPGYPLFLAGIYRLLGEDNNRAIRVAQAVLSTLTCLIVGLIALAWAPAEWSETRRRRALLLGIALAAICPFTAIYVSVILTETWATLLGAASALAATLAMKSETGQRKIGWWLAAGLAGGAATMFRPDAALFVGAAGLMMALAQIRKAIAARRSLRSAPNPGPALPVASDRWEGLPESRSSLRNSLRALRLGGDASTLRTSPLRCALIQGLVLAVGFAIALAPWTIRNARVFGRFQPIAPADAGMPGEFSYEGYISWLKTWVDDVRYTEIAEWPLDYAPIRIANLPDYAFDSDEEKSRVATLFAAYNNGADKEQDAASDSSDDDSSDADSQDSDDQAGQLRPESDQPQAAQPQSAQPQSAQPQPTRPQSGQLAPPQSAQQQPAQQQAVQPQAAAPTQSAPPQPEPPNQVHTGKEYAVQMTRELDAAFGEIARERITRHPFRYYVSNRLKRAISIWFDTHSQYYPFQGELLPLSGLDTDLHQQYWLPGFMLLTILYTVVALLGGFIFWRHKDTRIWLLFLALLTLPRIAFLSTLENPEPRYVVELFAFLAAAGGVAVAAVAPNALLARASDLIARRRPRRQAQHPADLA